MRFPIRPGGRVAALAIALALVLTACGSDGQDSTASGTDGGGSGGGELTLGLFNWAENIAVSNMWAILLEEQGYTVEKQTLDKSPNYVGVAEGDIDASLEVWLPTTDQHLVDQYEGDLVIGDSWYEGTRLGIVVPEHVDGVESIGDLAGSEAFAADGQPRIVGIGSGASITGLVDEAIDAYGLDEYQQVNSSEQAMLTTLESAIEEEQSVAVALWNPHWAFAEWDLRYLEDPKNVFGDGESIHYMHRQGLAEDHPEVVEWLEKWEMTDEQLSSLMATIEEAGDPETGAQEWIDENRELVDEWLQE